MAFGFKAIPCHRVTILIAVYPLKAYQIINILAKKQKYVKVLNRVE
jgi:hypothetical protein